MKVKKIEWHQVASEYELELSTELLEQIYPEHSPEEIEQLIEDINSGDAVVEDIVNDAMDNDVELEWDHTYDDWWTSRKGGFEVTYEVNTDTNFVDRD